MLNVLKLLVFALAVVMLSCADYKELNLYVKYGESIKDADGNEYKTVIIGEQVWMAENLKYKKKNDDLDTNSACYKDDNNYCNVYGRLYSWAAAMNVDSSYNEKRFQYQDDEQHRGICPKDWHIPTKKEWDKLIGYVGLNSADKLKSEKNWRSDLVGLDEYGFKALPGGTYWEGRGYYGMNTSTYWWSSTEIAGEQSRTYSTEMNELADVTTNIMTDKTVYVRDEKVGKSLLYVRCVKN